jgi:hypothetical protein
MPGTRPGTGYLLFRQRDYQQPLLLNRTAAGGIPPNP